MMNFKDILSDIFDEGTEEFEAIKDCYELINSGVPSISAECKTRMVLLDNSKIKLTTIYFMVTREISRKRESFQQTYDAQYTRLVKLGRPSNAAIEAEIRAQNSGYATLSYKIDSLEQVKDLILSYIKCIDANKQTVIEVFRDSRRID